MAKPVALLLKLRWQPALAALVGVTALFIVGVVVVTVSEVELTRVRADDNESIKDTVDRFNAYSGALMSVADEPLVFVVRAFVPVLFALVLRPMTKTTPNTKRTRTIACVAITAAVTNALASVNLQHVQTSVEARMGDSDAKLVRHVDANNASSIFQSLVALQQSIHDTKCTGGNGTVGNIVIPQVRFDLRAQPFFDDMLRVAVEPEQSCTFSVDMRRAVDQTEIQREMKEMPFNNSIANVLLALVARLEYNASKFDAEQLTFADGFALEQFVSIPGNKTKSMQYDLATTWFYELENERADITFRRTQLTADVFFHSVTIDIEHSPKSATAFCRECTQEIHQSTVTIPTKNCGSAGCYSVLQPSSGRVNAYQFCNVSTALSEQPLNCSNNNSGQMILYSVGRRIEGQELRVTPRTNRSSPVDGEDSPENKVVIRGIKPISSITVGILGWKESKLTNTYQAACVANGTRSDICIEMEGGWSLREWERNNTVKCCRGIALQVPERVTATNETKPLRVIMASLNTILSAQLPPVLSPLQMELAASFSNVTVIQPSNFAVSDTWKELSGPDCNVAADDLIAKTTANHFYSDESFRSACMGGLLFLFQNGRAIDSIPRRTVQPNGPKTFEFAANVVSTELVASVPILSVCISIASCVMLVGIVVVVVCNAHRVHEGACKQVTAAAVVNVLVNDEKFPKTLLNCEIGSEGKACELTALQPSILQLRCGQSDLVTLGEDKGSTCHSSDSCDQLTSMATGMTSFEESKTIASSGWHPDIPLVVQLRRSRLVVPTIVLVCAYVALLMILMGDGMVLHTVGDGENVEASVQRYSFYSGTVGAMLTAPAGLLVNWVAGAHSLTVQPPTTFFKCCSIALKLLGIWALTTAINSINIQPAERIEPRVTQDNLVSSAFAYYENGVTSFNSILRSFLVGTNPSVDFKCTKPEENFTVSDSAKARRRKNAIRSELYFAFTREPWHRFVKTAPSIDIEEITLNELSNFTDVDWSGMPVNHEQVAGQLVLSMYADSGIDNQSLSEDSASEMIQHAVTHHPPEYSNVDMMISRHWMGADTTFEVVTRRFNHGGKIAGLDARRNITTTNSSHPSVDQTLKLSLECSASGCTSFDGLINRAGIDVQVAPLCRALEDYQDDRGGQRLLSPLRGNCSNALLVVGVSSYVTGDAMNLVSINQVRPPENGESNYAAMHTVELVNATMRYEVMTGIMRWKTSDLADIFEAKCIRENTSCRGLQLKLDSNTSKVLIVAEAELDRINQTQFTQLLRMQSCFIRPSNFKSQTWDQSVFTGDNCSSVAENYVEYMEKNRLFMEKDQIDYVSSVAGMFYLFEKSRLYEVIPVSENSRSNEKRAVVPTTLSFDSNIKYMHIGVIIPQDAAIVSFVSMFGLLCVSLYLLLMELLFWTDEDSEARVTQASVPEIAEVMMDDRQYPKTFLAAQVLLQRDAEDGAQTTELRDLDALTVEGVTLRLGSGMDEEKKSISWKLQHCHSRQTERTVERNSDSSGALEEQPAIA